ncbi:MAG: DUF4982 domain-containing protein [Prolixibacteraceae bacterium]|nr:DUF4982 domain-containing protein [Prolixibacteraceae bacterium]
MKQIQPFFLVILAAIFTMIACQDEREQKDYPETRITESFNENWKFIQEDPESAAEAGFNDKSWRSLNVPHDWSIEGEFDQNNSTGRGGGYLPSGIGWYRKTFYVPTAFENRKVFIHFDGLMANSDVYINGEHLGHRPNGYVSLEYDLTDHLQFGKDNTIAVRLDNSKQPASRWYTGAGIYRNVRLIAKNDIHIDNWGVFVTTPEVSKEKATVKIQTNIVNTSDENKDFTLTTLLKSPDGSTTASDSITVKLPANSSDIFEQLIAVENPNLWSLDNTVLYTAHTEIVANSTIKDNLNTNFGIRTFRFDADNGFYLNGENIRLKGVCLHHGGGAVGAAVPLNIWKERLKQLQNIGINAIRTAHNPVAPEFLDLCDQMGFFVMNETFDTWRAKKNHGDYGYQHYFDEWWEKDTRSIVMRDRNHPSIFMISIGNEIRDNLNNDKGFETYKMQQELVHELDGTRPVTMGLFRPNQARVYQNGFAAMMDVVGQNYRENELLQASKDNPNWKVIGTENGHTIQAYHIWRDNPEISGHFLWTGIDYLGEADWPEISRDFGLFDRAGFTKPRTFERESWWSENPMIQIFRREYHLGEGELVNDWTPNDFDTYDEAHLEIYTNCDEVELFLNDKSLGVKKRPANHSPVKYQLTYQQGTIKAVGRINGEEVAIHEMKTAGPASQTALSASKQALTNNWNDVAIVSVELQDENGTHSPNTDKLLEFEVIGDGELVAVDNGSRTSHEPFMNTNTRRTARGNAIAIVRANKNKGQFTLNVSSEGLNSATIDFEIE